ncbi:MAG: patatin-like phospholipase family protein [Gemmatimonadota bacterium]|nr:MAG: patatin-like phospholipase family protein [Gemmatimonadota bacterium]
MTGSERRFTLVLGGGGMKGLAHAGALQALEERDFLPADLVGSSIGALMGAAWCAGISAEELTALALEVRQRDLFQVAHRDMALKRMRSPALYRKEPLEHVVRGLLGDVTFQELERPLFVNTVDVNTGTQVLWGAPGLNDVPVADAVLASCALPGYLPPHEINGRHFMDGAAVSNLPVGVAAARGHDLVMAVDVGASGVLKADMHLAGFAAVFARAIEIAIENRRTGVLRAWEWPPLLLVQPRVEQYGMFSFGHNRELVEEGYRATKELLSDPTTIPGPNASGVYPRQHYHVRVDREHCIGCGHCLVNAPWGLFRLDDEGRAVVTDREQVWSPVEAEIVRQCPTYAIAVHPANHPPREED